MVNSANSFQLQSLDGRQIKPLISLLPAELSLGKMIVDYSDAAITLLESQPPFSRYKALIKRANLLLTPDSGPMHISICAGYTHRCILLHEGTGRLRTLYGSVLFTILRSDDPVKGISTIDVDTVYNAVITKLESTRASWNKFRHNHTMENILVIRNDKLGDFILAWPALSLLKHQYPHANITVLVPGYTRPIAELCPWIDNIIVDDMHDYIFSDALHLSRLIKAGHFDASISLFSEMRTSLALWLARVPVRIGPATKFAQIFINKRLRQKRSSSSKPEFEYNADLARYFIASRGDEPVSMQSPPFLQLDKNETGEIKHAYMQENNIDSGRKLVFIHAGSGGSAINLSLQQYAELAGLISQSSPAHFVLTAGPDELDTASTLSELMDDISHSLYHSTEGLVRFTRFIGICDLFISGSTGPLHIAGALNVPTAAFYPARKSATSLRWQTLNQAERRIVFSPETYSGENDMQTIDIEACAQQITGLLKQV